MLQIPHILVFYLIQISICPCNSICRNFELVEQLQRYSRGHCGTVQEGERILKGCIPSCIWILLSVRDAVLLLKPDCCFRSERVWMALTHKSSSLGVINGAFFFVHQRDCWCRPSSHLSTFLPGSLQGRWAGLWCRNAAMAAWQSSEWQPLMILVQREQWSRITSRIKEAHHIQVPRLRKANWK